MIKARLELRPGWDEYDLHIYEKIRDSLWVAKPVKIEMVEIKKKDGMILNLVPFLRIEGMFANNFLPALVEALAAHDIKVPTNEEELKSVLKATEFHLKDMRKLVFRRK